MGAFGFGVLSGSRKAGRFAKKSYQLQRSQAYGSGTVDKGVQECTKFTMKASWAKDGVPLKPVDVLCTRMTAPDSYKCYITFDNGQSGIFLAKKAKTEGFGKFVYNWTRLQ